MFVNEQDDNVIHVVFGPDGGYRISPALETEAPAPIREPAPAPKEHDDPLADLYSRAEVARLFGLTEGRLRYWDRTDFLGPSARRGRRRYYTFQDLIGVRVAKGLLDAGIPLQEVRRSLSAIRDALPKVVRPLSELRVIAEGHAMLVRDEAGTFEPQTGQLVLDFSVETLKDDVVQKLRQEPTPGERRQAYARYLEGCRLDEEEATWAQAEQAYRDALALDPALASAYTNLGNLRYRQGDEPGAIALYRRALEVDAEQPEALYNLGFLEAEHGRPQGALPYFEKAVASDPGFADAHFHLAAAYEAVGRPGAAGPHWQAYLELEPSGEWADEARRRLASRA
ncbi:MAG: MerR family transcriptional regulator [Sandaracinus sp.]|nr:MerR family transcriptional regulator [Myxococcales bacterium]MAT26459.1 MerR family transcriptional regulator [Sandaracinus sp.]MBJ75003.1 MerR family transcriptional regulator [Sandaracinus sp.]